MRAGAPTSATRATKREVNVAIPLRRWVKFSATRSAVSMPAAGPVTVARTSCVEKAVPSATRPVIRILASTCRNVSCQTAPPAKTPGSRATKCAVNCMSAGIEAATVASPHGASSAKARSTAVPRILDVNMYSMLLCVHRLCGISQTGRGELPSIARGLAGILVAIVGSPVATTGFSAGDGCHGDHLHQVHQRMRDIRECRLELCEAGGIPGDAQIFSNRCLQNV